jgi:hypothetical protein
MKKCKVTLAPGETKTKYFYLFPDAALLHRLAQKTTEKNLNNLLKHHPEVEVVSLKRNQWIEVEWNGCDIHYESGRCISTSFFRLAKAAHTSKKINEGSLLSLHFGWMLSDHLRMNDQVCNGVKVATMLEDDEQFDFSELFQDNETSEDILKSAEQHELM